MLSTVADLKRWTILNIETGELIRMTDKEFGEAVITNQIELRSRFIERLGQKIWIDGVIKQ